MNTNFKSTDSDSATTDNVGMTWEAAINFVYNQKKGDVARLKEKIGRELFAEFCLMGIIKRGSTLDNDGKAIETWKMTENAESEYKFYSKREPDEKDKEDIAFYRKYNLL
jgi:hypothetical protein